MGTPEAERLASQLRFLLEADGLKTVERSCLLADGSRRETSAEHSWHLAVMALVLSEYAGAPLDLGRVRALIAVAIATQTAREAAAARRLFGVLPDDQDSMLTGLRDEFEEGQTPEARFARALDAFQPTWQHWGDHANPPAEDIAASRVLARKRESVGSFDALWQELTRIVNAAAHRGLLVRE